MKSKNPNEKEITIIEPEIVKSMVYIIRGQKVMLDFELAELYGYETKVFNQQVKNNIEKFDETFRFQLNKEEFDLILKSKKLTSSISGNNGDLVAVNLKCKNVTSSYNGERKNEILRSEKSTSSWGGRRKLPYAFTEQGVYMLMTILKGEVATKQSIALIKMFKDMKDYIIGSNNLLTTNEILKLSKQVDSNTEHIKEIETKLETVMDNFIDPTSYKHFLILNGERLEADVAFQTIYSLAKHSLIIIDDYISVKTLQLLKICAKNIRIIICSDNVSRNGVTDELLEDFRNDFQTEIRFLPTNNLIHDRYIAVDYDTDNEKIFHAGSSSKDAGNRITTIMEVVDNKEGYHKFIDDILGKQKE